MAQTKSIYQASLMKGAEQFFVRCGVGNEEAAIAELMGWAENPDLEFDWFDAAVLSRQINQQAINQVTGNQDETED